MMEWTDSFEKKLIIAGIDVACEIMGFPFKELFIDGCIMEKNPYDDYYWCVYTTTDSRVNHSIYIHAIPPLDSTENLPWEEWFVMEGQRHHHVCYKERTEKTVNMVEIPLTDADHPLFTVNKRWFWYIDRDIKPVLYR